MKKADIKRAYSVCAQSLIEGRVELEDAEDAGFQMDAPVFTVGQTAQLADIHPQTLRQYDRLGLIVPQRTVGGARRYSLRDIQRLTQAQHLSQDESINLAGITRILSLMEENRQLKRQVKRLRRPAGSSVFAAGADGEVIEFERAARLAGWRSRLYSQTLQIEASSTVTEISAE
jgi:MerR family transcriptional regulator/heat shock protein HspR